MLLVREGNGTHQQLTLCTPCTYNIKYKTAAMLYTCEPYVAGICSGLREVRIQIPTAVKKGDSAILNCWYDTEGDLLYAVKWYKGGQEFYRYAPNEIPVVKTFPIGNLTVKVSIAFRLCIFFRTLDLVACEPMQSLEGRRCSIESVRYRNDARSLYRVPQK